jgi:hypothetical protein
VAINAKNLGGEPKVLAEILSLQKSYSKFLYYKKSLLLKVVFGKR